MTIGAIAVPWENYSYSHHRSRNESHQSSKEASSSESVHRSNQIKPVVSIPDRLKAVSFQSNRKESNQHHRGCFVDDTLSSQAKSALEAYSAQATILESRQTSDNGVLRLDVYI